MKFAKRSTAYYRLYEKNYIFNYFLFLVNLAFKKGLKIKFYKIILGFLGKLKKYYKVSNSFLFFFVIISKYIPVISFLNRKVAAIIYNLPFYIHKKRAICLILRWFIKSVKQRYEYLFVDRLFYEFKDLAFGYGKTVQKFKDHYYLALKNRPFLRYLYRNRKASKVLYKKYKYKIIRKL